jgi:hypothetical protein
MSFDLYSDSGLTTLAPLNLLQTAGVAPAAVTGVMYLGSPTLGQTLQKQSNPGVAPLVLSVVDANALTGASATLVKLALSSGGLSSAVGGAPLNLPHTVLGGPANAVPIHYRFEPQALDSGVYTDLSFLIADTLAF